ncbi:uncharacterized protein LOC116522044 [Thamnophis elegans]|uniref:uncharacterized protein LOC116522044 n=1 Tax=Thamnophis elegans TaxID=35005 RepID=UPI001377EBE9|nr:uncharacterized protein LOC116522044 [Thamnophis elegans]
MEEGLLDPSTEPTNPLQNASLRIPHASFNHNGEFVCSYEEKRSNRWFMSSLSQAVNITVEPDPLPPPVLKLHLSSESPGKGKVLSILCVSSESNNSKRFHFSKDGVEMTCSHEEPVKSSRNSGLLTLNMLVAFLYAKDNESLRFACRYEENINGRWVISPWSETITGSQKYSSLPAPRLSSSIQHDFIIKGEEISLNCSLPKGVESGSPEGLTRIKFFFYCRDQSYLPIGDQFLTNNTFNFRTGHLNSSQIKITCTCEIRETSEGWTFSPESNQLVFSVIDGLRSPVLKVEPLSQRVKEGDPLLFLCSTEGDNAEKKIHFYKDGVEITSREEGLLDPSTEPTNPLQNASLRIPHASFNHNGEFACSYEEKRSNRWVKSSLSQAVNITVEPVLTQDSDPIWRYSWMAIPLIVLIILLVPLAFYCWKKKSSK